MKPPPKKFPFDSETSGIFDPKYTFENFIVGPSNASACAAAKAVAQMPGTAPNPLIVCGMIGKTHLLHAIGQSVAAHRPDARISYVTTEAFTNEFIAGDQPTPCEKFLQKCLQTDLLLIDDNQFLADKESIQVEFSDLFGFSKYIGHPIQIVLSCGCPASKIQAFGQRLAFIFECDFVVHLPMPEIETMLAIMKQNPQSMDVTHPEGHFGGNMKGVQIVTLYPGPFTWPPSALPKPSFSQPRWSY